MPIFAKRKGSYKVDTPLPTDTLQLPVFQPKLPLGRKFSAPANIYLEKPSPKISVITKPRAQSTIDSPTNYFSDSRKKFRKKSDGKATSHLIKPSKDSAKYVQRFKARRSSCIEEYLMGPTKSSEDEANEDEDDEGRCLCFFGLRNLDSGVQWQSLTTVTSDFPSPAGKDVFLVSQPLLTDLEIKSEN